MPEFPAPEYIQLYPTLRCNQNCSFCFNSAGTGYGDMSREDAAKLLDTMEAQGIGELDIMGGEPFLIPWMPDVIRDAAQRGIRVNASTNGSQITALKDLQGISPGRLTVGISLEGSSPELHDHLTGAGNFGAAVTNLRWLASTGLDPLVKTVVSRKTAGDLQHIIDLIRDIGVRRYYLIHMDIFNTDTLSGMAFSYPEFMRLSERISAANTDIAVGSVTASCFNGSAASRNVRCTAGSRKIAVMPDGSVFPCNLFQSFPEFRLGNIFSDSLSALMSHQLLAFFRTSAENRCSLKGCPNAENCTGGCPAHGYFHYRDLNAQDLRCRTGSHRERPR